VDLGLICDVQVLTDVTTVKLTMTSPRALSRRDQEDVKTKLDDADFRIRRLRWFGNRLVAQRISEAGRKSLGI
jgi:metal-sulfur cluster biosynthetic enzyme